MDLRVVKSQRIHLVPDRANDDAVEQEIGGRVVADGGHEPCSVLDGEDGSVVQVLNDPRAGHLIDLENRNGIGQ